MSCQQNMVLQRTSGASVFQEENSSDPQGDSRILRYIKTLTSHQTNAKQQRMDGYLQQVKRPKPAEYAINGWKPSQHSHTTSSDKNTAKVPSTQLVNGAPPRGQHNLDCSNSVGQSDRTIHGANPRKDKSLSSKRSYEGKQSKRQQKKTKRAPSKRQQKKPKRAPSKQQIAVVGSFDRFSFKGAWSQDKQASDNPTGNKTAQQTQVQLSTRQPQPSLAADPEFTPITDFEQHGIKEKFPVEVPMSLLPKVFSAQATPTAAQNPRNNFIQHSFLSPEEEQQGNHDCALQQEVFVTAYDPLSATMESIYF